MDTKETRGTGGQAKPSLNVGERVRREAKAAADSGTLIHRGAAIETTPLGRGSRPSAGTASLTPVQAAPELMSALKVWRDQVQAVRTDLKTPDEWKALSAQTRTDYAKKFEALGGRLPSDVAKCKKSYYVLRAAYLHGQSRAIRKNLNALDKWTKENDGADLFKSAAGVRSYMDQVRALGLDTQLGQFRAFKAVGAFSGAALGVEQPQHGKRKLGALPWHWKTKLLGAVPRESKYRLHVAAMAMCGCRPSEFEGRGVLVEKVDEDTYTFKVYGKKTGERSKNGKTFTTGQTERVITITRTDTVDKQGRVNPEFLMLDRAMRGKDFVELNAKATAIRDVVIHASERVFPHLANKPTAYSFRHAFASNLKAQNGVDSRDTAAALGHASTKTQGCYGYGRSGGGGLACKASASDPIRTPHLGRIAGLNHSKTKKMIAVKVNPSDSIDRVLANAKPPTVSQQMARVVAKVHKVEPPKPVPSFAKPMRFR